MNHADDWDDMVEACSLAIERVGQCRWPPGRGESPGHAMMGSAGKAELLFVTGSEALDGVYLRTPAGWYAGEIGGKRLDRVPSDVASTLESMHAARQSHDLRIMCNGQ